MLKTPEKLGIADPVLAMIAAVGGRQQGHTVIDEGMIRIGHFSSDILLYGRNGPWNFTIEGVPEYGVCDSPDQFMEKFGETLRQDPRNLCVFFTHIAKEPHNRGQGGGWRWHKWGEYIGDGTPECEYLDDESGFDSGVYVYHIHDIDWKPEPRK